MQFPTFDVSINIWILLILLIVAAFSGFAGRSRQIAKRNRDIAELEQEMIQAHAELLDIQRDYCELESRLKEIEPPPPVVIPLKSGQKQDPAPKPMPGRGGLRKDRPTGTD